MPKKFTLVFIIFLVILSHSFCLIFTSPSSLLLPMSIIIIMNFNSTEPVTSSPTNRSGMEAYLQRFAHLDEGLYNDFFGLWIALMVINSLIFLVGHFYAALLALPVLFCNPSWLYETVLICSNLPLLVFLFFPGGHGAQPSCTLCFLFSH